MDSQNKTALKLYRLTNLIILLAIAALPELILAQTKGSTWHRLQEKSIAKQKSRWTLQDWMAQQDRNKMMDLWLAMNSPSPFEYMIGLSSNSWINETRYENQSLNLQAYAQMIGLRAELNNSNEDSFQDTTSALELRLFGNSLQNSLLTIQAGQRTREFKNENDAPQAQQNFTGVTVQLYLSKYFGMNADYLKFQPYEDHSVGKLNGSYQEVRVFIDFDAVRIFGSQFTDTELRTPINGNETTTIRSGSKTGIQIFF